MYQQCKIFHQKSKVVSVIYDKFVFHSLFGDVKRGCEVMMMTSDSRCLSYTRQWDGWWALSPWLPSCHPTLLHTLALNDVTQARWQPPETRYFGRWSRKMARCWPCQLPVSHSHMDKSMKIFWSYTGFDFLSYLL